MQSETINRPTQKIQNLNTVIRQIKSCFIDTRSKNAPQDLVKRKTTCEIHQNTKIFLAYDERSPRLECKYAFKVYFDNKQIIHLEYFPLSFRIPTIFKPILNVKYIKIQKFFLLTMKDHRD